MAHPSHPLAICVFCLLSIDCTADRAGLRNTDPAAAAPSASAGSGGSVAHGADATASVGTGDAGMKKSSGSSAAPVAAPPTAASVGAHKPNAALDPNISFSWPETSPHGTNNCQAGTYVGMFDCVFTDPSGLIPDVELTGPVSLTFSKSMNGEFLEIAQGDFEALGNLFIGGKAKIQGKLDCNTLTLDAMAVDGQWTIGDPNAPLVPGGGLEGAITGTLDPLTGTLSGQWSFADPAIGACPGTWSVMYMP